MGYVFGDPHINTFDGLNYTFNAMGEFALVHSKSLNFDVQARFEQLLRQRRGYPALNATRMTAVVARDNESSTVEFRLRPSAAQSRYQMYVIVDKQYITLDPSVPIYNFRGVTLYQPRGIQNMSHVIAAFDSSAGVEVITNQNRMSVHVYAPKSFLVYNL
jgi:hypothetical protein